MMNLFIDPKKGLKDPLLIEEFNLTDFELSYSEIKNGYRYKKVIKVDKTNYIEIGVVDKNKEHPAIEYRQKHITEGLSVLVSYEEAGSTKVNEITYSILESKEKEYRSKKISILDDGNIREYNSFGRHKVINIYDSANNLLEVKIWDTGKKGDSFEELYKIKL